MSNNRQNQNTRPIDPALSHSDPGPYLAKVVSHLDNKFMGSLQVQLLKVNSSGTAVDDTDKLVTAFYASPFYGTTSWKSAQATDEYSSTQQSYGMWFVPPDPDTKVLVTFVEGRRDICYWFACVPDDFMNFMIPDGRAATTLSTSGSGGATGRKLPVGEYNKLTTNPAGNNQPTNYVKPVNTDFVNRLNEQGLLEDDFRGLTSTSARREVPSAVFGINTPGPLDKRPGAPIAPRGPTNSPANVHRSRLGGSSIVMDDGDDKLVRSKPAGEGPPSYVQRETDNAAFEPGAETRPANELIRLRTRTGHQILLHNTEDLIYISNARGTAWVELTSNGKIDVYAQDSISMHTEGEFNITADSNINLTSGENVNINAVGDIRTTGRNVDTTATGRVAFQASSEFTALAGDFMSLKSSSDLAVTSSASTVNISGGTDVDLFSGSGINLVSSGGAIRASASSNFDVIAGTQIAMLAESIHDSSTLRVVTSNEIHLNAGNNLYATGGAGIDLYSGAAIVSSAAGRISFKSAGNFEVGSPNLSVSSGDHNFNGNSAVTGTTKARKLEAPNGEFNTTKINSSSNGASASTPSYSAADPGNAEFATDSNIPSTASITPGPDTSTPVPADITARVPQHEPWFQHENLDPVASDVRAGYAGTDVYTSPLPDTFLNIGRNSSTANNVVYQPTQPGINANNQDELDVDEDMPSHNYNEYNDNVKRIVDFFIEEGFESWVGAGVAGSLIHECGKDINPGAYLPPNDQLPKGSSPIPGNGPHTYGARGICQWRGGGPNGRLTNVEKFLGKSILAQPVMDPFNENYRIRSNRLPSGSLVWTPPIYVVPANSTLEEQLGVIIHEWNSSESITLRNIRAITSGSNVNKARLVAGIFNDDFLRSQNPLHQTSTGPVPVKTLRQRSAAQVYTAYVSNQSTDPVTVEDNLAPSPVISTPPVANGRPRYEGDTADSSTSSNVLDVMDIRPGGQRRGPLRPALINALNRAASETGIVGIRTTSLSNEPRRIISPLVSLPLTTWFQQPLRTDMRSRKVGRSTIWLKLNTHTGKYENRDGNESYVTPGWATGSERHDTGLAVDAKLFINDGAGGQQQLLPNSVGNRAIIEAFIVAFAKYGGRAVAVGNSRSGGMPSGVNHYDMLGGFVENVGYTLAASTWGYPRGSTPPSWIVPAIQRGINNGRR
jgi:uncharacterized protein (DUF2345 family)